MDELISLLRDNLSLEGDAGVQLRKQGARALADSSHDILALDAMDMDVLAALIRREESCDDALRALTNLLAYKHVDGLEVAAEAALEHPLALLALQNGTTRKEGCDALVKSPFLTRLLVNFSRPGDTWAPFGHTLRNLTAHSEDARKLVFKTLKSLVPHLDDRGDVARRRGVAAAVKHCAADKDSHFWLMDELRVHVLALKSLADEDDLKREDDPPDYKGPRDPDPETSLLLLELLHCLCATRRGRRQLRSCSAYVVVRDTDYFFAPGQDDRDVEPSAKGHMVTTAPDDDTEKDSLPARIATVCAALADMLLRDEGDSSGNSSGDTPQTKE